MATHATREQIEHQILVEKLAEEYVRELQNRLKPGGNLPFSLLGYFTALSTEVVEQLRKIDPNLSLMIDAKGNTTRQVKQSFKPVAVPPELDPEGLDREGLKKSLDQITEQEWDNIGPKQKSPMETSIDEASSLKDLAGEIIPEGYAVLISVIPQGHPKSADGLDNSDCALEWLNRQFKRKRISKHARIRAHLVTPGTMCD
jgi:hypothetical protein